MDPKRSAAASPSGGRPGGGLPSGLPSPYAGAARKRPAAPGGGAGTGAGAGTLRSVNIQEALDQLGKSIQQLRIDFERFFSGGLTVPPDELRGRIQIQMRQLRNANLSAAVDSFRLSDLEARYNTYNELFNRRLREREEGRHVRAAAEPEAPRYDPLQGILVADAVAPAAAEALYVGLSRGGGEPPRFDLDSFQTYIERQAAAIRAKTGCAQVQFRLADEDGKLKLKARPVA